MNSFDTILRSHGLSLQRGATRVLQVNVGKKCNQTCVHCHVNAGPARREQMTRETMARVLDWLSRTDIGVVDITGGAPELNPHFRFLAQGARALGRHVMDRCNLTVLWESGQEDLARFLAANEIEIVASLPCYDSANVEEQRGEGVFDKSIRALQLLNSLGYGDDPRRVLNLVYNPNGAFLPPSQAALEADYKRELAQKFGIRFNRLFALANLPVSRFASHLRRNGQWDDYQALLLQAFNPSAVAGVMCRDTLNVGWTGEVYDCDFNAMLPLPWREAGQNVRLWELDPNALHGRDIATGGHCFGCTAGAGSSCGGALAE